MRTPAPDLDREPTRQTSEVPGGRRLSADDGGLTITVTTRPAAGRFVLLSVVGGCDDVPVDEQDAWFVRPVDDLT